MRIPGNSHTILLLLALTTVTVFTPSTAASDDVPLSSSFHCPDACTCSDLTLGQRDLKHARCESTESLQDKQWSVNSLDLSGLELTKVPAIVEKLRNLTRLDLSNNHITEVARISPRVHELNLGYNKIGSGKLAKLPPHLRKLNLTHNHITVVPAELMRLDHLRELELAGNPINCSCETIQVRNWLQSHRVWTENVIKCALPQKYKGRPWLQVKQSEVCTMTPAEILEEKNIWEDSNDLMMGDQPAAGAGSGDGQEHDHANHDILDDQLLPVDDEEPSRRNDDDFDDDLEGSGMSLDPMLAQPTSDVEGSGSVGPRILSDHVDSTTTPPGGDDEEEDEEGSGAPIVPIPIIPIVRSGLGEGKPSSDFDDAHDEDKKGEAPIEQPDEEPTTPGAAKGLGIFGNGLEHEIADTEAPIVKDTVPEVKANADGTRILGTGGDHSGNLKSIEETETADSKKLYILLAIILIVMVGLIVIVVVKQRNTRRRNNRRGQADVENAKMNELQDMNKRLVGKPLEKRNNGTSENAPLMGQRDKSDFARPINGQKDSDTIGFNPYEKPSSPVDEKHIPLKSSPAESTPVENNQSPALGSFKPDDRAVSKDSINEENNNNPEDLNNNNQFHPIQNGYPQENGFSHSPPMESPPSVHKQKRDEDWEKYTPKSPDMKRYSPVYSPETGRVKIKLAETQKPKTPLLVTRSRSNAGQIITTPNLNQRPQRPMIVDVNES